MELGLDLTATTQQAVLLHTPGGARNARADRLLDATGAAQGTSPDAFLSRRVRTIPSGRAGAIDDIAGAVCFLVSERSGYVNGAALVVDGSRSVLT
jgi:3-oxoacyl-[acyl-carrier protein] reductase